MRRISELLVLATVLIVCSADCRPGLNGRQDWYRCEDLTNLQLQIPAGAVGIDIKNSNIKKIPADAFSLYANSLQELNITECGVEEIEQNAFRGLDNLRVLGLVGNRIRKLNLPNLPNLKALIVWSNRITEIDPQLYDSLPNLQTWDIAYNELVACLPSELLKKLTKLGKIYIAGNPWSYRCRPSMTWYLGRNHVYFVHDWGSSDRLVEDCLTHEPRADSDEVLYRCVTHKIIPAEVMSQAIGMSEQIRRLTTKITQLEAEVAALKRGEH